MGYHTYYSLNVTIPKKVKRHNYIELLRNKCKIAQDAFDSNGEVEDNVEWYNHEKDLKEFSKKHSKVLFTLSGEGEENKDMWKKYFLNGKMQVAKAKITFDPFDKSKLED